MPDWLSDLVPRYLTDTNCFLCPTHARTGMQPNFLPGGDPKLTSSYSYEFCGSTNVYTDPFGLAAPGDTMKSWKTKQLAHFGDPVPVLRCSAHASMLNVSYSGELWDSDRFWEYQAELRLRIRDPAGMETWVRQLEQDRDIDTLTRFAWSWATSFESGGRNGVAAVRLAESAAALTKRKDGNILDTLAVAYAEAGQFERAVGTESEAIAALTATPATSGTEDRLRDFQKRKELFVQRRPYRE